MITVYGIGNCDTIRKTLNWMREHQLEFEFFDYKKKGISTELINEFLAHFEMDELLNRRGTTWRKQPDSIKNNLTRKIAITLMCSQPSIIKRPIIKNKNQWSIGYSTETLESLLAT